MRVTLLAMLLVVVSIPVGAQTVFAWPASDLDVAQYTRVEDCFVATRRVLQREMRYVPRTDTIPARIRNAGNAWPAKMVEVTQRCAAKFAVGQIAADERGWFYQLLLLSNRDEEARTLAQNWLAAVPATEDTMHLRVLSELVQYSLAARPVRFDAAWPFIRDIETFGVRGRDVKIGAMLQMFWEADRIGETQVSKLTAQWLDSIPKQLTDSVKTSFAYQFILGPALFRVASTARKVEGLDSLRRSTVAYHAFQRQLAKEIGIPYGELSKALPLQGEFWFPGKSETARPTPGKISLVCMILDNEAPLGRSAGIVPIVVLRRLLAKYPDVELTLVAQTRGFVGPIREPVTPAQEAALVDSLYLKQFRLPSLLVVATTPFWRLPEPDRRRIDEPGPNDKGYPTHSAKLTSNDVYLVDRDANIIFAEKLFQSEEQLDELIAALKRQPVRVGQ